MSLPVSLSSSRIAILFHAGQSAADQLALKLARSLKAKDVDIDGKSFVGVSFTDKQLDIAHSILKIVKSKKSTQVFFRGELEPDLNKVLQVLSCYSLSLKAKNPAKYCHQSFEIEQRTSSIGLKIKVAGGREPFVIPESNIARKGEYGIQVPCRLIYDHVSFRSRSRDHASDLIESEAVKRRCEICPNWRG